MRLDLLNEHAKEKFKLPTEWSGYNFDCLPHRGECFYIQITGAVAPMKPGGTDAIWDRDWKKKVKGTKQSLQIGKREHDEWLVEWEKKTGKCWECLGSGKQMESCGPKGTTYRPCPRCAGTGKTKEVTQP